MRVCQVLSVVAVRHTTAHVSAKDAAVVCVHMTLLGEVEPLASCVAVLRVVVCVVVCGVVTVAVVAVVATVGGLAGRPAVAARDPGDVAHDVAPASLASEPAGTVVRMGTALASASEARPPGVPGSCVVSVPHHAARPRAQLPDRVVVAHLRVTVPHVGPAVALAVACTGTRVGVVGGVVRGASALGQS